MGRIMLATSASTDEEYGGTTANMYKKISSNITDVAISSPIGSLYFADVNVDITSLGLSNAPTEVLVSYITVLGQGVAPISVVVSNSTTTAVTVRLFRTDNNQKATGKITLLILD
jgi:hypothetical protein